MWVIFALIGVGAMIAILAYDRLTRAADADPQHSFNTNSQMWVRGALIPITLLFVLGSIFRPSGAVAILTTMFAILLVASIRKKQAPSEGLSG